MAFLEAVEAARSGAGDGGPGAPRAVAALPAGWRRGPDGRATPTFMEGAALPAQRERSDGDPPLRL
eukprot:972382-Alexandrium_andersonii.AAC.1